MVNIKTLHFKKDQHKKWHIILPDWQGDPDDLEMVSGADTLLNIVSEDGEECTLCMSESEFEGSHTIELIAERSAGQGGDYLLKAYNGTVLELKIWLCEVTRWVWGCLPAAIYFRKREE